jgi:hypothetical protein
MAWSAAQWTKEEDQDDRLIPVETRCGTTELNVEEENFQEDRPRSEDITSEPEELRREEEEDQCDQSTSGDTPEEEQDLTQTEEWIQAEEMVATDDGQGEQTQLEMGHNEEETRDTQLTPEAMIQEKEDSKSEEDDRTMRGGWLRKADGTSKRRADKSGCIVWPSSFAMSSTLAGNDAHSPVIIFLSRESQTFLILTMACSLVSTRPH